MSQKLFYIFAYNFSAWWIRIDLRFFRCIKGLKEPLLEFGKKDTNINGSHVINNRHDILKFPGSIKNNKKLRFFSANVLE